MQISIETALNGIVITIMVGGFIYALICSSGNSDVENEDEIE
jgi:hypothetical protein